MACICGGAAVQKALGLWFSFYLHVGEVHAVVRDLTLDLPVSIDLAW